MFHLFCLFSLYVLVVITTTTSLSLSHTHSLNLTTTTSTNITTTTTALCGGLSLVVALFHDLRYVLYTLPFPESPVYTLTLSTLLHYTIYTLQAPLHYMSSCIVLCTSHVWRPTCGLPICCTSDTWQSSLWVSSLSPVRPLTHQTHSLTLY